MVARFFISLIFFTTALTSCDPYRFRAETEYPVECRIFSDHNSVSHHLYGFDMHPGAVVELRSLGWTQYDLTAYLKLHGGEGFEILLRPIVGESVIDSGLHLRFLSAGGMRLDSAGIMLYENPSFKFPSDEQAYITIYNEESYIRVTVGCDTVVKRYTKRIASDEIVLKTLEGSELSVLSPEWRRIKFTRREDESIVVHQVRKQ